MGRGNAAEGANGESLKKNGRGSDMLIMAFRGFTPDFNDPSGHSAGSRASVLALAHKHQFGCRVCD